MSDYLSSVIIEINKELSGVWPDWKVVRIIGRGSFGSVYEIHRYIGSHLQKAALKVIHVTAGTSGIDQMMLGDQNPEHTESFYREYINNIQNEIVLMQQFVGNSHIISYEDHAIRERTDLLGWNIYIRMELLTGLQEYLKTHKPDQEMVLKLGLDISKGLSDCHREGIIHRDIKPQNIFINKAGDFKIGDFGVSRFAPTKQDTLSFKGTVAYMAPEVFHLKGTDVRSDIYSLGMVLYQLLNDYRPPFLPEEFVPDDIERVKEMRFAGEEIPYPAHGSLALKQAACKALAANPDDRFQTAEEFHKTLERISRSGQEYKWESVVFNDVELNAAALEGEGEAKEENRVRPEKKSIVTGPEKAGDSNIAESGKDAKPEADIEFGKDAPLMLKDDSQENGSPQKGRSFVPFIALAAIAVVIIGASVKLFMPGTKSSNSESPAEVSESVENGKGSDGEDDFAIDWKDPALEAKMRVATGIESGDIMYSDVEDITVLYLDNDLESEIPDSEKISDISALKNLKNLKMLLAANNKIQDISPLSEMENLAQLDIAVNQVSDISPLKNLTNLTILDIGNNPVEDFSVLSEMTNLKCLYMPEVGISDLSVLSGLTGLEELYLEGNKIKDISVLQKLDDLKELDLDNNQIEDFSVLSKCKNLELLYLNNNQISDISMLKGLTQIHELCMNHNKIEDISVLSEMTKMENLYMFDNQISDISALSGMTDMVELELSDNQISDISALSGMTMLKYLNLNNNPVTDLSPIEDLEIEEVYVD